MSVALMAAKKVVESVVWMVVQKAGLKVGETAALLVDQQADKLVVWTAAMKVDLMVLWAYWMFHMQVDMLDSQDNH